MDSSSSRENSARARDPPSSNPFETTPAENFAVGADGITPPAARPVDGMTAEQVAAALGQVERALEAS